MRSTPSGRIEAHFLAVALIVLTLALGASLGSASARELILAVPPNEDRATRVFVSALNSAPQLKEAHLTFRIVRSDALGLPSQTAALLLEGTVQMALLRANQIPGYDTSKGLTFTTLLSHPLMVRDSRQQFYVESSVVGDAAKLEIGRKGFVVLGFWNALPTFLVFKKPVKSYADLKGMKVQAPDPQSREVLLALGASPTALVGGEIVAAMERGVVDAVEMGTRPERDSPFLSVASGGSLVGSFQHRQGFLVANEASWIGLRQRERVAIKEAAEEATSRARAAVLEDEAGLPAVARGKGLTYTSFTAMGNDQSAARSTWLRRVGNDGTKALGLFDEVIRQQKPPRAAPGKAPRSALPPRVFFATNRNDEGGNNLSYRFGIDRSSSQLVCGEVRYAPDAKRAFGIAYGGEISAAGSRTLSGATPCAQLVAGAVRGSGGELIVFIHGFHNSFDFAVRRAIAFTQDFGVTTPVLVFSWPSFGEVSGYAYDLGSVTFTRPFTKELAEALLREPGLQSVALLAHSMGSQIALQFLEFTSESRKAIESIIFVAPDVPRTNFVQGLKLYGPSARLATLYANEHDRALRLSEGVNREAPAGLGGSARLTMHGVETVDVSDVDRQLFEMNHSHGFDVQKVADDLSLVLRRHLGASKRQLSSAMQGGMTYWMIKP
jgi:TRAP-type C4-dicarboxylate transport system substrate-binding protein/pimeloyl-ACP methyl ester carboxylesterase